ncbi:hypothetical protein FZC84_22855 [Rossellomorea vietnamensis]|uniref:Uncharacterized protein n=1 Tax=Rossellomorea vietnamensis TaxID=218284 RepID=A0A5D4LYE8_9BACI|nr:hypothetical protein [Rossellomorea vietnamensis]TYR93955.1 hypothetical protein FZC84_22855 [Rossellomorea vietnamensis]
MKIIKFLLLLPLVSLLFLAGDYNYVLSKEHRHQSSEEIYREIGYQTIDKALKEFEVHYGQSLDMPLRTPPIPFTHTLGRFNNLDGDEKDSLEVKFINEKTPDHHYKITIRSVKHRLTFQNEEVIKVIKLNDGKDASYLDRYGFNVLVFERGPWQYMLSINKRASDLMLPGVLVQIANSINMTEAKGQ